MEGGLQPGARVRGRTEINVSIGTAPGSGMDGGEKPEDFRLVNGGREANANPDAVSPGQATASMYGELPGLETHG
jgi:hypothetical protein